MPLILTAEDAPSARSAIADALWGVHYAGTTRTLDQHIAQLRRKLGPSAPPPLHRPRPRLPLPPLPFLTGAVPRFT